MPHRSDAKLDIAVDRSGRLSLSEQIAASVRAAVLDGRLAADARLPSWQDLAVQLGVARGTVQAAYERLADEGFVYAAGSAGTLVARSVPVAPVAPRALTRPLQDMEHAFFADPLPFEMGLPAQDAFPATQWARMLGQAARTFAAGPTGHVDPRGVPALREQIAAYLALARGIQCHPDQIIVTGGYRNSLGLTLAARGAPGRDAWVEDPGYPVARRALAFAGLVARPVPVDEQGLDVERGIAVAPDAALAIITPGQQCPLGCTLSEARRTALVDWAREAGCWIIEDDYLSELQLDGRVAPAVAAMDGAGTVFHAGTFSKTLSPTIGLGFLVAPFDLAEHVAEVAAYLAPAPSPVVQMGLALFMRAGHYLRHLRRMKRLYGARRDALVTLLTDAGYPCSVAGLAVILWLPDAFDDVALSQGAVAEGIALLPLSPWYATAERRRAGLVLGIANLTEQAIHPAFETLRRLIARAP